MNRYKINLHAHSIFSDGSSSVVVLAEEAKALGFTALVITDHYYGKDHPECGLVPDKLESYTRAIREAKSVLPVIRGIEVPFLQEEILVFGTSAIKDILDKDGIRSLAEIKRIREHHNCAMILCHPNCYYEEFIEHIDGYERYNDGTDYFENRELGVLEKLPGWCNSDAHHVMNLGKGYNLVSSKIATEDKLIKYIKSGAKPEFVVRDVIRG